MAATKHGAHLSCDPRASLSPSVDDEADRFKSQSQEIAMKKLVMVAVLAGLASPALAQSDPNVSLNAVAAQPVPVTSKVTRHTARTDIGVYDETGALIGADPDANVRMDLRREFDNY
jgi:hypothetical protein